jgi:hypothetical protein
LLKYAWVVDTNELSSLTEHIEAAPAKSGYWWSTDYTFLTGVEPMDQLTY